MILYDIFAQKVKTRDVKLLINQTKCNHDNVVNCQKVLKINLVFKKKSGNEIILWYEFDYFLVFL